jgi:hypothetical protein
MSRAAQLLIGNMDGLVNRHHSEYEKNIIRMNIRILANTLIQRGVPDGHHNAHVAAYYAV